VWGNISGSFSLAREAVVSITGVRFVSEFVCSVLGRHKKNGMLICMPFSVGPDLCRFSGSVFVLFGRSATEGQQGYAEKYNISRQFLL
jgi:hypothetical protein